MNPKINILNHISKLNNAKVLVVGDVMLDRYWFGQVNRISPEAPVPIARITQTENRPGGAANVARNIATLGGDVTLLSVIGNDEPGTILSKLLDEDKVKHHLMVDPSISTIVKLRILAQHQQLIRVDFEDKPTHEVLQSTLDKFKEIYHEYSVIIFSDYGKGGLNHVSQMIQIAKKLGKTTLVDPKGTDYSKYLGATIITPNRKELADATGGEMWNNENELISRAHNIIKLAQLRYLLVTRSEEGMSLFDSDTIYNYPTMAQEVFDVSGAGDTVIATLGLCLANDYDINVSVILANLAASVVVAKVGTATLDLTELNNAIKIYKESK